MRRTAIKVVAGVSIGLPRQCRRMSRRHDLDAAIEDHAALTALGTARTDTAEENKVQKEHSHQCTFPESRKEFFEYGSKLEIDGIAGLIRGFRRAAKLKWREDRPRPLAGVAGGGKRRVRGEPQNKLTDRTSA